MKEVWLLQAKDSCRLAAYHDGMKRQRELNLIASGKLHGKIRGLLRKLVVGSRTRTLALLWSIPPNGLLARLLIDTQLTHNSYAPPYAPPNISGQRGGRPVRRRRPPLGDQRGVGGLLQGLLRGGALHRMRQLVRRGRAPTVCRVQLPLLHRVHSQQARGSPVAAGEQSRQHRAWPRVCVCGAPPCAGGGGGSGGRRGGVRRARGGGVRGAEAE
jgi:hypothetical protein